MKSHIEQAGFVNVVEEVFKIPLGGWPADRKLRELGLWALLGFDTGAEGYNLATLTRVMGVSAPRTGVLSALKPYIFPCWLTVRSVVDN